jgi:DNA-binding NarL/FixJ family response regulator
MTADTIRILTADDHPMLRGGIAAVLGTQSDMVLVGEADNGVEAIDLHRRLRPDVTLMDLQMPGLNGVDAIIAIRRETPGARIIVLTTYAGDAQALRSMKAGAAGYLLKNSLHTELLTTIRTVHSGGRYLPPALAQELALHAIDDPLTRREIEILRLVAAGQANRQIGAALALTEGTVKAYLKSVFAKLDVTDRTHAVTTAARRGIIDI